VLGHDRAGFLPIRKETSAIFACAPANEMGTRKRGGETRPPDEHGFPIHRSAWKVSSANLNFGFTAF
jgi:hypothetical protein